MACIFCQLALGAAPLAMWLLRGKPRMNPARKHILVTGGSEGIGRSMAEVREPSTLWETGVLGRSAWGKSSDAVLA